MKAVERRSSFGFWIWGFVFIFLLHAFAIFWFSDRTTAEPLWQKPGAFFYVAGDAEAERRIGELASLRDPTLFALPHAHGFSGSGWLKLRPQVPTLTNWSEPPEWLVLSADQLGSSLNDYVATNRPSEAQLFASLRATKSPAVRIPDEPVFTKTVVRVEGELATRKLIHTPPLPSAERADVLRPTIVVVSVNGDGVVESVSVAAESGLKDADDQALKFARLFEFEPVAIRNARTRQMAAPTIGRLVFLWSVMAPTNAIPAVSAR
jgi:hypothetical protein